MLLLLLALLLLLLLLLALLPWLLALMLLEASSPSFAKSEEPGIGALAASSRASAGRRRPRAEIAITSPTAVYSTIYNIINRNSRSILEYGKLLIYTKLLSKTFDATCRGHYYAYSSIPAPCSVRTGMSAACASTADQ